MQSNASPPLKSILPAAVLLMLAGWAGLGYVILETSPTGGSRWALYFSAVLALTGTALPAVAYLHRRFPSNPPPTVPTLARQSLWIGIYLPTLGWLQIGRVLTPVLAVLLAVGLGLIEFLLRLRERSQWRP